MKQSNDNRTVSGGTVEPNPSQQLGGLEAREIENGSSPTTFGNREVRCWIEPDAPILAGNTFKVLFQIGEDTSPEALDNSKTALLVVYLHTPGCKINLRYQDLTVPGRDASEVLTFEVEAKEVGSHQFDLCIYKKSNMNPIDEFQATVEVS